MSNLHRSIFTRLCLIALLLWGQSAVAQHELDHSWHDATELCQVFSSADNAKVALIAMVVPNCHSAVRKLKPLTAELSVEQNVAKQTARDPPANNTI